MSDAGIGAFARLAQGDPADAARMLAASLPRDLLLVLAVEIERAAGWEQHMVEHDVDDWTGRRSKVVHYLGAPADESRWIRHAGSGLMHCTRPNTDTAEERAAMRSIGLPQTVSLCGVGLVPWDGPGADDGPRCQRCAARSA